MRPLISVIVPVYNTEKYLERCLTSILEQTYANIQVILIDDGSKDNSSSICDAFARKDARVRCVHKRNGGLVSARKAGLSAASGEYVAYVDSDDWIDRDYLERAVGLAMECGADVVSLGVTKEFEDSTRFENSALPAGVYKTKDEREYVYGLMLDRGNYGHFGIPPFLHSKLFRRESLIQPQQSVDERIVVGEDVACVYPCLLGARSIAVTEMTGYHYRIRNDSLSATSNATDDISYKRMLILYDYLNSVFAKSVYKDILIPQSRRYLVWGLLSKFPSKAFDPVTGESLLFANLNLGEKTAVYGAGAFGRDIAFGFKRTGGCELAAWADRDYADPWKAKQGIINPDLLGEANFEKVILATVHGGFLSEMEDKILKLGIPREKIAFPRLDIINGQRDINLTEV